MKKLKIVYFGTPDFSAYILKALMNSPHEVVAVVTSSDKPSGRGLHVHSSEVKKTAQQFGIQVLQPVLLRDEDFIASLKKLQADVFIVIAFRMLPKIVWEIPPFGTYNIHASLLPKYRGAAPIQHALLNGEAITGVTLFKINEDIDTGDILAQRKVPIEPNDCFGTLHDKLKQAGSDLLREQLNRMAELGPVEIKKYFISQNSKEACPAPKISKIDLKINWEHPSESIRNRIRAFSPYPGAECLWKKNSGENLKIKIFEAQPILHESTNDLPGTGIIINKKKLIVLCGNGKWLDLRVVQPEGRKKMNIADFLNGNPGIGEFRFT